MKMAITSVIVSLALSLGNLDARAGDSTEDETAKRVVVDYFRALNEGNVETIVSLYHKNSVFLPNNAPASRGIEEIEKAYRVLFKTIKLDTSHIYKYVSVSGDTAVIESKASGDITVLKTKKTLPSTNNELFVLKNIQGQWKIDRYMFNSSERR